MQLSEDYHKNKTFENLSVPGGEVTGATFDRCTFLRCNLQQTVFDECTFNNCTFEGCDLSLIRFKSTTFNIVNINNSKAIGIAWRECSNPVYVGFKDSQVSYSSFYGKKLKKMQMVNCVALEADFTACDLQQSSFERTDLAGAHFSDTDLTQANFAGARNYEINPATNRIKGAKFSLPDALSLLNYLDIQVVD